MAIGRPINKNSYYAESEGFKRDHEPVEPQQSAVQEAVQAEETVEAVQPQETVDEVASPEEVAVPAEEESQDNKPSAQESFKAVRTAKERAEFERDLYKKQLEEYARMKSPATPKKEEPFIDDDIDFSIEEDGLMEGRHAKKITNRIKTLEKRLKAQDNMSRQHTDEAKIKSSFPDFDDVVSAKNVELLNYQYPEIAKMLSRESDLYTKAEAAYSVMKKYGIHRSAAHHEDRVAAVRNTQKPRPLTSASPQQGDSPLSQANRFANGLTSDLKVQLLKEMNDARRNG